MPTTYNQELALQLEVALSVLNAIHGAANLPGDDARAATVWAAIREQLEARGLNYASIIKAQATIEYEIDRLKTRG